MLEERHPWILGINYQEHLGVMADFSLTFNLVHSLHYLSWNLPASYLI